jgi:hypothetical protein
MKTEYKRLSLENRVTIEKLLSHGQGDSEIAQTNTILHRIGVQIFEDTLMTLDTIVDADGKLEYDLNGNNFLELSSVVRQSRAIAAARREGQMPIVFTPKIERLGGVPQGNDENTVKIVPGVSYRGQFVTFLNGEGGKKTRPEHWKFFFSTQYACV